MTDMMRDVAAFHEKFRILGDRIPMIPAKDVHAFRMRFLQEELTELRDAYDYKDLEGYVDALIDIVYVALGTALLAGVPPELWDRLWSEVQRANMAKTRAPSAQASKRGSALDVVKPPGWTPPDVWGILDRWIDEAERARRDGDS